MTQDANTCKYFTLQISLKMAMMIMMTVRMRMMSWFRQKMGDPHTFFSGWG